MNTTISLLDRLKRETALKSDYAIAKELNTSRQAVSHYRTGRSQMDTDGVFHVAELLGMSHAETLAALASIEAERAKDEQTRATWQARLKRLGGIAATVTVAALGIGASAPADAAHQPGAGCALQSATPYCFQKRRRMDWHGADHLAALIRLIFQQLKAPQHFAPAA
jgi:hypothetical protein